jgi:hypothetical protein
MADIAMGGIAPLLKRFVAGVAGFPPWRPGFDPGSGQVLRFPLPIFIPPIGPQRPQSPSPIIWGWYNRPEVAVVQGTSPTPVAIIIIIIIIIIK